MRAVLSPRPARARAIDAGVPLRLAVGDFAARVIAPHIVVTLNGSVQQRVVGYDVPRGEVTVFLADGAGRLLRDTKRGGPVRTVLHGTVEVRWRGASP